MSARAPVSGTPDLKATFSKSDTDPQFGCLNIGINFDTNKFYVKKYTQNNSGNIEDVFKEMLTLCVDKEHTYFLIRDPTKTHSSINLQNNNNNNDNDPSANNNNNNKSKSVYILIHFAPDLSPVKQRMMYAASRPSLKVFLGRANFSEDYHCSSKAELSYKKITDARTLHHNIDFRSDAEIEKQIANQDAVATSAQTKVLASLPIDIRDTAKTAINNYISSSCKCVFLTLNNNDQSINGTEEKVDNITDMCGLLNDNEPKYILFWYKKTKIVNSDPDTFKGDKRIFGYYCPDKADRKLRFTYSTCKTNIIDYCNTVNLQFYSKIEFSTIAELTNDYLDYHIFPVKDKKDNFAMPKGPKTRRKSKNKKRKKINVDDL